MKLFLGHNEYSVADYSIVRCRRPGRMAVLMETNGKDSFNWRDQHNNYLKVIALPHDGRTMIAFWGGNAGPLPLAKIPSGSGKTFWRGTNRDDNW